VTSPSCSFSGLTQHNRQIAGTVQYAFDANHAIDHAKEDHIAIQRRHPQSRRQIVPADIAERGTANPLALIDQSGKKMPGIGSTVPGDVVADIEQVLPGLWRKSYDRHQAARLPRVVVRVLVDGFAVERFGSA